MSKYLIFNLPKADPKALYSKLEHNPETKFKDTEYYRQKHHLKGMMNSRSLASLKT